MATQTNSVTAGLKSAGKYILWTAIAAAVQAAIDKLPGIQLPIFMVPVIAMILKGAATVIATKK